ncbi:unnamed protein product [Ambrosiozyma monospora]|uniref:Unnamed protein product n=1 Tax=Ambrosiozyma monospora TaxID=43982 RepID=A0A9W6Z0U6_AMBMO|nr:unnamed protein product [Ambrosiozyma monospora]
MCYCKYDKAVTWEQDAFDRGITFGRSNQYKKIKKQLDEKPNPVEDSEEDELTLSQKIAGQNIPWVELQNSECLFVNVTPQDFTNGFTIQDDNCDFKIHPRKESPIPKIQYTSSTALSMQVADTQNSVNPISSLLNLISLDPEHFLPHFISYGHDDTHSYDFIHDDHLLGSSVIPSMPPSPPQFTFDDLQHCYLTAPSSSTQNSTLKLTDSENELLTYFINSICPVCVCYPSSKGAVYVTQTLESVNSSRFTLNPQINPYLYLIVPLASRSTIVLNSIVAASSYQKYLLGHKEYDAISGNYTKLVLSELPNIIKEKQETNSSEWDDVLATIIMLCFKEISSNCGNGSSWLVHLEHAKEFLKQTNVRNSSSPLCKFFTTYFISHEVMRETASSDDSDITSAQAGKGLNTLKILI